MSKDDYITAALHRDGNISILSNTGELARLELKDAVLLAKTILLLSENTRSSSKIVPRFSAPTVLCQNEIDDLLGFPKESPLSLGEPSMEDILASIRRILSEDESEAAMPAAECDDSATTDEALREEWQRLADCKDK